MTTTFMQWPVANRHWKLDTILPLTSRVHKLASQPVVTYLHVFLFRHTMVPANFTLKRKKAIGEPCTEHWNKRVLNDIKRTTLSCGRMIWLLPHPLLVIVLLRVAVRAYWQEREVRGAGGAESHTTARCLVLYNSFKTFWLKIRTSNKKNPHPSPLTALVYETYLSNLILSLNLPIFLLKKELHFRK